MDWFLLIILSIIFCFMVSSAKTIKYKLYDIKHLQNRTLTKLILMESKQNLIGEILVELRKEVSDIQDPLKPQPVVTFTIGPITEQN